MPIAALDRQQALGALRAAGSTDADILHARKEGMLAGTKRMKLLGVFPIIVGVAASLTIVGAVIGIPAIMFGVSMRKRIRTNIAVADAALAEYLGTLAARKAQTATA